jgi:hypothetical protein
MGRHRCDGPFSIPSEKEHLMKNTDQTEAGAPAKTPPVSTDDPHFDPQAVGRLIELIARLIARDHFLRFGAETKGDQSADSCAPPISPQQQTSPTQYKARKRLKRRGLSERT